MKCHFLVILFLCVNSILTEEICSVGDIMVDWFEHTNRLKINSSYNGMVEEFEIRNVKDSYFKDSQYLTVKIVGNKMQILTTDDFKNYEKTGSSLKIKVQWYIMCEAGGRNETFKQSYIQYIIDENKHDPKFLQEQYVYKLYGDLKKGLLLSDIIPIKAHDADIYTQRLYFYLSKNTELDIASDNFENKTGSANLRIIKDIKAGFKGEYEMTVHDHMFEESRFSTVKLTLIVEEMYGNMKFENSKYAARLTDDQKLDFEDEIKLTNGLDFETDVKIRSDYVDYFSVSTDMLRNNIIVKLTKPLPLARSYSEIHLYLDAYWKGLNATTEIVISSKKEIEKLCYIYGMDLYNEENSGESIKDDHTGSIRSYNMLNVESVECSGPGTKYISCKKNGNKLDLSVTDEFNNYEKNEHSQTISITMSVECPYETRTFEYTQFVEDINNHDPQFNQKKYSFIFYNQLPTGVMLSNIMPLTISDMDIGTIYFNVEVEHEENEYTNSYLQLRTYDVYEKQATCELYTKKIMPPGFDKDFKITVRDSAFPPRSSEAIVSIKVIKEEDQLKFKQHELNAVMRNNVMDAIELENGFDPDTKFKIRSEYADYFQIRSDMLSRKIELIAIKDLSTIQPDIVRIIIEAEWHGIQDKTTVYIYMNGELPPTTIIPTPTGTSPYPTILPKVRAHGMEWFKLWALALNITQIIVFSVAGTTLCGMAYVAKRYYY